MPRTLRARTRELTIAFLVAFVVVAVPCSLELVTGAGERATAHGLDLRPLFWLGPAVLGLVTTFLGLPFTRLVRLAGALDAALWGATHALGGMVAVAGWAAVRARPGGDFLTSELVTTTLLTVTFAAALAPVIHHLALSLRPGLACEARAPLPVSPRVRLPLLAIGALALGVGLFVALLLTAKELGWRGANPYATSVLPFAAVLGGTSFLLRRQLAGTLDALLFGGSYGVALGLLHAVWLALESGIGDRTLFPMCFVLLASSLVSAVVALAVARLGRARPVQARS